MQGTTCALELTALRLRHNLCLRTKIDGNSTTEALSAPLLAVKTSGTEEVHPIHWQWWSRIIVMVSTNHTIIFLNPFLVS